MIKSRQLFVPSLEVPWGHRRASFSTTNFRMALAKQPAQVDLATDFVIPEGDGNVTQASQALAKFIRQCKRVSFITGAGMSTASGIPDYRSPTGAYSKGKLLPVVILLVFGYSHCLSRPSRTTAQNGARTQADHPQGVCRQGIQSTEVLVEKFGWVQNLCVQEAERWTLCALKSRKKGLC